MLMNVTKLKSLRYNFNVLLLIYEIWLYAKKQKTKNQQQPVCSESEAVNITKQGCVSSLFQKCVS